MDWGIRAGEPMAGAPCWAVEGVSQQPWSKGWKSGYRRAAVEADANDNFEIGAFALVEIVADAGYRWVSHYRADDGRRVPHCFGFCWKQDQA